MKESNDSFLIEVWTLFGVGITFLMIRFATRLRLVGFKGLQGDDYCAMGTTLFYTIDALVVHITYNDGTNLDYSQQEVDAMTPDDITRVEIGSKLQLVAWYSYTALIWCLKGTMIFFFRRLTIGTWQARNLKWITWFCIASYIAVVITITAGCRPYQANWQVNPIPPAVCSGRPQNLITVAIFNVLTDAALLTIPMPLLWKLKVPLKQKLVIAVLLSSGVFVIVAAILRVVFSAVPNPSVIVINSWGVRETIVGILSVNAPILRPIFTKDFWGRGGGALVSSSNHKSNGHFNLSSMKPKSNGRTSKVLDDNDSQDFIVGNKHDVTVETTIEIRHDNNDVEASRSQAPNDWRFDNSVEARPGV